MADCIFRWVVGAGFVVLGFLYMPWLAFLGLFVILVSIWSCAVPLHGTALRRRKQHSHDSAR